MHTPNRRGLSLLEVLLVLCILTILFTLLLSSVIRSHAAARKTVCVNNLKQLNYALEMYRSDYDGVFPPDIGSPFVDHYTHTPVNWATDLQPYIKHSFPRCPDLRLTAALQEHANNPSASGYAFIDRLNVVLGSPHLEIPAGVSDVVLRYPSLTVAICDARVGLVALRGQDTATDRGQLFAIYPPDFVGDILSLPVGAERHNGGANYLFVDGHVQWLHANQVQKTKTGDGIHPRFGL